ncbi:MAG: inositol monophosphatase [Actinomycetota bacterium]|nr:inositol monophosphatase [Actinomycetota bacterium]
MDPLLDMLAGVALVAAQGAATLLSHAFGGARRDVSTKSSPTDMVSEVDEAAEAFVSATLSAGRPDDALLGEEGSSRTGTTGVRWVVDPLDGTTNFLFGIPAYAVSIAAEVDGEAVVGIVIDPSRGETWAAVRGGGARCNGYPCQIAIGRSRLSTALVGTGFGYRKERRAWQAELLAAVLPRVRDVRRSGSAALDLCWVAGGRLDAYYEWGLNPWDLAAGGLICQEAGAEVEILAGRTIVAAVPELMHPLVQLLSTAGALAVPEGPEPEMWAQA